MRRILPVIIAAGLLFPVPTEAQSGVVEDLPEAPQLDLQNVNKTMAGFETAFRTHDEHLLESLCTKSFRVSAFYRRLAALLGRGRINSGYASQTAQQNFVIAEGGEIAVTFALRDGLWVVEDGTVHAGKNSSRAGKRRGFSPLAADFHFSDFKKDVEQGKAARYAGIAPYGQLPPSLFNGKHLSASVEAKRTITDLIVYEERMIRELFYLQLRNSERIEDGRRGWLIDGGGPMADYARAHDRAGRLLVDVLQNRTDQIDLSRPSSFIFVSVPMPPPLLRQSGRQPVPAPTTPSDGGATRITRIATEGMEWGEDTISFQVLLNLAGERPDPEQLSVNVENGEVVIRAGREVAFTAADVSPHPYLAVTARNGEARLRVRSEVGSSPVITFLDASLAAQRLVGTEQGYRITLDVVASKNKAN